MGTRHRLSGVVIAGAVTVAAAVALVAAVLAERTHGTCSQWSESTSHGGLILTYAGYGTAETCRYGGSWEWRLAPRPASAASETHAALACTADEHEDLTIRVRFRTVRQLREPTPQPWEVAWVVWHYTDDQHFYYLILKPNGWELGKEDPAYPGAQRYLATEPSPSYDVHDWHTAQISQAGDTITVKVDGRHITRIRDAEHPYSRGRVGLYTEDAVVHFTGLRIT